MKIECARVFLFLGILCIVTPIDVYSDPSSTELNQAIDEVIKQREYQWRMPREVVDEEEQGLLFEFLEGMANTAKRIWKPIAEIWDKIRDWLRRGLSALGPRGSGREWSAGELNVLIITLIVLVALLVLFFVWRNRKAKRAAATIEAEPILPIPDIADEHLVADQLPEEGWQQMAQDLLARGELRLALRAMFMGTVAHLAQAQLITVARFKSNREYLRELQRRAYDQKTMHAAFDENVAAVDSVWYGMYPVTADVLSRFIENVETVKKAAA